MDLIKITLLLAFVTLCQCNEAVTKEVLGDDNDFAVTAEETEKLASPSRRLFHINDLVLKKQNNQCICLPQSPAHASKVTDLLHPIPDSTELRMVVYIFRNSVTGKYKIYIPNLEKQRVFPDITVDANEVLRPVDHTLIFNKIVFNVNAWVTVKRNKKPHPTTQKPIHITTEKPHHQDNWIISDIEIINQLKNNKLNGLIQYLHRFRGSKKILGTLTGRTLQEKLLQLKRLHPSIYIQFMQKLNKFYPVWLIHGSIVRFKPNELHKFPYDVKLIPILNGKKVIINGKVQPNRKVQEIIVYTPKRTIINRLYPEYDINVDITFDQWLDIMLKGLHTQLSFASKVIDIVALRVFILNVMQKHGLILTSEGHVIDSFGLKIKLFNLILRPILIGESTLISTVINNGLFRIPSGVIFLEALLISATTVKSLGIIPITHIFVGHREEIISETTTVQIIESITRCENDVCKTTKICKNEQGQEEPCKDFAKSRSEDADRSGCKHKHCKHRKTCKDKYCREPIYYGGNPRTNQVIEKVDATEEVEIPNADPSFPEPYIIMNKDGNVISSAGEAEKSLSVEYYDATHPHYLPIDEGPGIRIVGGNAATNSGTPVNVKG